MNISRTQSARSFRLPLLLWCVGLIYGSLIPFDFHARSLAEAWRLFRGAPWLEIGMGGRADWIANLLVFMPLAYLMAAVCIPRYGGVFARAVTTSGVFAVCVLLAVTIEYVQVFFPPRTVSINDIVAEVLGGALGLGLWWVVGDRLTGLIQAARGQGRAALNAVLVCYLLAYLALSLFPYDFLVSRGEIAEKLASDSHGWLLAPSGCDSHFRCLVKSLTEILAVIPFGVWLRLTWRGMRSNETLYALGAGLALGVVIESAQFFTASGISQGMSVFTRAAGFCLGYYVCSVLQAQDLDRFRPWMRPLVFILLAPYIVALVLVNGIHPGRWLLSPEVLDRVGKVHFLPFYYYYFTTETRAMVSLLAVTGMYAPIGAAAGAWSIGKRGSRLPDIRKVALVGGAVCAVIECMKLLDPGRHPDFTDVLIAAAGAAMGLAVFRMLILWFESDMSASQSGASPL